MVVKRGDFWCVVHGSQQKAGSKTDQPIGTTIKCYSIKKYGNAGARELAYDMHYAIQKSKEERGTA